MSTPTNSSVEHPGRRYPVTAPTPPAGRLQQIILVLLLGDLLIILAGIAFQWHLIDQATRLRNDGVVTSATVIGKEIEEDDDGTSLYVSYTFTALPLDGARREVTRREQVDEAIYARAEPGGRIEIIYASTKPDLARITAHYTAGRFSVAPALVSACVILTGTFTGCWFYAQRRKAIRLDRDGVQTTVRVLDLYTESDSDGDTTYYVAYQLPSGQHIRHAVSANLFTRLTPGSALRLRYLSSAPDVFRPEGPA